MFQLFVVKAWQVCPEVMLVFQKPNKPAVIKDATYFIALYDKHSALDKIEARLDLFVRIVVSSWKNAPVRLNATDNANAFTSSSSVHICVPQKYQPMHLWNLKQMYNKAIYLIYFIEVSIRGWHPGTILYLYDCNRFFHPVYAWAPVTNAHTAWNVFLKKLTMYYDNGIQTSLILTTTMA